MINGHSNSTGVRGSLHEDREFAGGEGAGDVIMPEPLPL
jgi:hypothetical protein